MTAMAAVSVTLPCTARARAVILDGRDQGLGGCLVVQVIHHQISALMGEGQCDGSANPLLRSGY